jgi:hypothetical protein
MSKTSKLVLIVTIAAGIASPVLAQSRDIGRNAFGMVPSNSTFADPALTGGGSVGYNADLPKKSD